MALAPATAIATVERPVQVAAQHIQIADRAPWERNTSPTQGRVTHIEDLTDALPIQG